MFVLQLFEELVCQLDEDLLSPDKLCKLHRCYGSGCWGPQGSTDRICCVKRSNLLAACALGLRKEGMTGVVTQENQGSDQPLNIKAPNGQTWWYQETGECDPRRVRASRAVTGGGTWNSKYTVV